MKLSEVKVELLAPAGKWDALEAVVEAGADAVYLGGKRFNMRSHRKDYNFTPDELNKAVDFVHRHGKRLYVTVNSLLGEGELEELGSYLEFLYTLGVDAIIVQDLAVVSLVRDRGLHIPRHASTMMNVHSVEMARELAELGITRVITSRDITLAQVKEIHERAGVEVEYFVHGDMCVAQSGLCYSSGILFGKSSNRGECMKPCRWNYTLVESKSGERLAELTSGHFLAIKDMCLLSFIPELIHAGICSFKIEGRMRHADFLREIVGTYRKAIDSYLSFPFTYYTQLETFERLHNQRVRELSTCNAFSLASSNTFDYSGRREPLFFSRAAREERLSLEDMWKDPFKKDFSPAEDEKYTEKLLAVKVASLGAMEEVLEAGADYIYLAGEVSPQRGQGWIIETLVEALRQTHRAGKKIALGTPRITTGKELGEVEWLLEMVATLGFDAVLVHNLGTLRLARQIGLPAISDYSFNILNTHSARLLKELGAERVTASLELSYQELSRLAQSTSGGLVDLECLVHGSVIGMTLEHCLPAIILAKGSGKEFCRLPCRYSSYALKDEYGEERPIEVDQHCRNHLLLARDLCVFPYLESFLATHVRVFRIEAQYYKDETAGLVVKAYRWYMDSTPDRREESMLRYYWESLLDAFPKGLSLAGYTKGITRSQSTVEVMRSLVHTH